MKRKEIEQLEKAGIISTEQAAAIAKHFHLNGTAGRQWLVWSMSSLAGVLILNGWLAVMYIVFLFLPSHNSTTASKT